MDLARAAGNEGLLKVAGDVLTWTDPGEAADMLRPYLLRHPRDWVARTIWQQADSRAEESALREELSAAELDALPTDPGDLSDLAYLGGLLENGRRVWEAHPQAKTRLQARSVLEAEIIRRQGMPPWQVERLCRAKDSEALLRVQSMIWGQWSSRGSRGSSCPRGIPRVRR